MRVIGVIALVLAILLSMVAGVLGVARWVASGAGVKVVTDVFGDGVAPVLAPVEGICKQLYLDMPSLLMLIGVCAALFVIAIFSFAIVNANKKRAIQASYKKVKKASENDDDALKKALPYLAAGVLVSAAIVGAAVVLRGRRDYPEDDCCYCRWHR